MIPLDIFTPTKVRTFNYYDRCAIRLDADEMTSVRLRISLTILATPVSRSLNFKYPYSREFYGYGQAFYVNSQYADWPINYVGSVVYDYWNQHLTIAHQITSVLQRLVGLFISTANYQEFVLPPIDPGMGDDYDAIRANVARLTQGLTFEQGLGDNDLNPANDRVNSFNHPFDLVRFKFPFGTVFNVTIDSWQPGITSGGSVPGHPTTEVPYDPTNPSGLNPVVSPGSRDPANPYGFEPPDSSPLDPSLDPSDFSNAPDPNEGRGYALRVTGQVQISGLDTSPRTVDITSGCINQPIMVAFEANPSVGFDAVSRSLSGELIDIFFTGDLLGTATLTVVRCDL